MWKSRSWAMDHKDGCVKGCRHLELQRRKPDVQTCCSNVVVRSTDGALQIRDADDWQYPTSGCSNLPTTVCLVNIGEPSLQVYTEFTEWCPTSITPSEARMSSQTWCYNDQYKTWRRHRLAPLQFQLIARLSAADGVCSSMLRL